MSRFIADPIARHLLRSGLVFGLWAVAGLAATGAVVSVPVRWARGRGRT